MVSTGMYARGFATALMVVLGITLITIAVFVPLYWFMFLYMTTPIGLLSFAIFLVAGLLLVFQASLCVKDLISGWMEK